MEGPKPTQDNVSPGEQRYRLEVHAANKAAIEATTPDDWREFTTMTKVLNREVHSFTGKIKHFAIRGEIQSDIHRMEFEEQRLASSLKTFRESAEHSWRTQPEKFIVLGEMIARDVDALIKGGVAVKPEILASTRTFRKLLGDLLPHPSP